MIDDKWSSWSDKEKKLFQHSVPWDDVIQELYKTCSRKQIFNLMETGELSYVVNMIDEAKPHGLDALWLYGSDRLESFLRDYNVCFYRDSLSDILGRWVSGPKQGKPEKDILSQDFISLPDVTRWSNVTIEVVTGGDPYERGIEIKLPGKDEIGIIYEDLKLIPDSVLVEKLELLARGERFNNKESGYKSDVSRLRVILKKIFPNIKGDPIPFDKKKDTYKTAFNIKETKAIVD